MGWALSEDRIGRVSVYLDGTYLTDCTLGAARPDVGKAYPGFPDSDKAGWGVHLDPASLPPGKHELVFEAATTKRATRDIGAIPITIVR